jgi:hypothetical protein
MRNVFHGLIGAVIVACASLPRAQDAMASPDGEKSNTTFYEAALMCPRGCRSRMRIESQPILLSLEKMPAVAEPGWIAPAER